MEENKSVIESPVGFWVVLIAILVVVCSLWLVIPKFIASGFATVQEKGVFGDSFGSVNALFTGLAFGGLIFTILLQRRELRLQRKELQLQREEMKASRAELAAQVNIQERHLKAIIVQMEIASLNAAIPAYQLKSQRWPADTDDYRAQVNQIFQTASQMSQKVDRLRQELKNEKLPNNRMESNDE